MEPSAAARGESVSVTGKFPEFEMIVVQLKPKGWSASGVSNTADGAKSGKPNPNEPEIVIKDPKTSFSFVVPLDLPLGQYEVLVSFKQKNDKTTRTTTVPVQPNGTLRIVSRVQSRSRRSFRT